MPKQPNIQEILSHVDQLPQPPQVALKLTQLLEKVDTNAEQLSQVIQMDPGLTSQVLRICNSSAYGLSRTIATIKEAIAMLGFNTLKSMVYTIISHATFDRPVKGYDLEKGELWKNAATCALYGKFLANKLGKVDSELTYTAAILRDIGKLVLSDYVSGHFNEIEARAIKEQSSFEIAETEILGISHTKLGQAIAEKWNLPDKLRAVIGYHHEPSQLPADTPADILRLTAVVHLADIFTMMLGNGIGGDGMMYNLDHEGLSRAGIKLDSNDYDKLYSELLDLNDQVKGLLDSFGVAAA